MRPFIQPVLYSLVLLLFISLPACKTEPPKPVTKEEARTLALQIEKAIDNRDGSSFDEAIDKEEMIRRSRLEGKASRADVKAGLEKGVKLGHNIVAALSSAGSYKLVKQYEDSGRQHLIFRLYDDGSINYHDLELVHSGKDVKIADIFVYTSGENLSETLHGVFDQLKDEIDSKNPDDSWVYQAQELRKLAQQKEYVRAEEVYQKLPPNIRDLRAIQVMHVMIASGLTLEEYDKAIQQFKTLYPDEKRMDLLYLDGYILHQEYDKALGAIEALDKMINTDPLLDYYRYLLYHLKDDDAKGFEYLQRLNKNMPEFEDGAIQMIAYYLNNDKPDEAKPLIAAYRKRASFNQKSLTEMLDNKGYTE